ncbi:MAG: ATP-dependent helicase [Candidatus Magnetominusculus sp. LBB02]|nr:ATP-dependent helicase [Candidatus Magnetominusculus sp. LBB02]
MPDNPSQAAAQEALTEIYECITEQKSFIVEAGAGAGKTRSLVEALRCVLENRGKELLANCQQVACISYTNVASDEIASRIDSNPAIHSSTIHSFCWLTIKDYQHALRKVLPIDAEQWVKKLNEAGINDGVGMRKITYDKTGYRSIDNTTITLHHNDVLELTVKLIENYPKFRKLFSDRYPVIFIDEYQDTNKAFVDALIKHFLKSGDKPEKGLLLGFFGDSWQKIYDNDVCGAINHPSLERISLRSNFRSAPVIINILNKMRDDLKQETANPEADGFAAVYHTNDWTNGKRRESTHWKGDLPADDANSYLEHLMEMLRSDGWDFAPDKTKILMLTHRVLAKKQGYDNIANIFRYSESYIGKKDPHISFLIDMVDSVRTAYENKKYGVMFEILGSRPFLKSIDDKMKWRGFMDKLLELCNEDTIGDIIEHIKSKEYIRLPESVQSREDKLKQNKDEEDLTEVRELRKVKYKEIPPLADFINKYSPFDTQHGVKGAEFENVLFVIGRGWSKYDFNEFLEDAEKNIKANSQRYERNRNLFYVVCSRAKKRLAVLFTQELSNEAINTLKRWFGSDVICALKL